MSEWKLLRQAGVFYSVLLMVAWLVCEVWFGESLFYLKGPPVSASDSILRDVMLGVAVGLLVVLLSRTWIIRTQTGRRLAASLSQALPPINALHATIIGLLSGTAEEAFFRGALLPSLGLVGSSILFGLVHFVPKRAFLPWVPFAIVIGFMFGSLFSYTGNLLAPVLAHVIVNSMNLHWLSKRSKRGF